MYVWNRLNTQHMYSFCISRTKFLLRLFAAYGRLGSEHSRQHWRCRLPISWGVVIAELLSMTRFDVVFGFLIIWMLWNSSSQWGPEFADNLFSDISKMILSQSNSFPGLDMQLTLNNQGQWVDPSWSIVALRLSPYIKRKACICLLRLYRKDGKLGHIWKHAFACFQLLRLC